jgi:hypothetical protein
MTVLERIAPFVSRLALLSATFIFAAIARKYILDPVGTAQAMGMLLQTPLSVTDMRSSFGAFPLALAVIALTCATANSRHVIGLAVIATVIAVVLTVRLIGISLDGTLAQSGRPLLGEIVLLTLNLVGLLGYAARRKSLRLQTQNGRPLS